VHRPRPSAQYPAPSSHPQRPSAAAAHPVTYLSGPQYPAPDQRWIAIKTKIQSPNTLPIILNCVNCIVN